MNNRMNNRLAHSQRLTTMKKLPMFCALLLLGALPDARAQSTAFTYQGLLNSSGAAANGSYDLRFALYDAASNGVQQGATLTNAATAVSNGYFSVTLDFGNQFPVGNRWLEIAVRTNGGGAFSTLSPRQPITATPYAVRAANFSGLVGDTQLSVNISRLGTGIESSEITDGTIVNADINAAAGIADIKLATISTAGKVANSATTATSANTPSAIVARDASAGFSANTITASNLVGGGAGLTALNASQLASGTVPDARLAGNVARTNQAWLLNGNAGTDPATNFLGTTDNRVLELRANGTTALRLSRIDTTGVPNLIGGFGGNTVEAGYQGVVIAGGGGAGVTNRVLSGNATTISGGSGNTVSGEGAVVAGGVRNTASAQYTAVGGGCSNRATGLFSSVLGGGTNLASGSYSMAMGRRTIASGHYSTALGFYSEANGELSTAMGRGARALHDGSFVWADAGSDLYFDSTASDQFLIRASGGVGIGTASPVAQLEVASSAQTVAVINGDNTGGTWLGIGNTGASGQRWSIISTGTANGEGAGRLLFFTSQDNTTKMRLEPNGNLFIAGTYSPSSDRNVKTNFAPVDSREILEKVASLPLSSWAYKQDAGSKHIGPMAQDFYAAFGVGTDDKHIATVDADGVALAAIQGLNQKLEQKETEITELKQRMDKLEQFLNHKLREGAK